MNILDLVGKTVWHWQFCYSVKGRQILAASPVGKDATIRHAAQHRTVDIGGLSIPDDLPCQVKEDRVEIDLGDAHVVLRMREAS